MGEEHSGVPQGCRGCARGAESGLSPQNSTLTIEEFHAKLQEATNFPLRPFVIPFLKVGAPAWAWQDSWQHFSTGDLGVALGLAAACGPARVPPGTRVPPHVWSHTGPGWLQ